MNGAVAVVGTVYLIGAGPGDPGLLTLKGKKCLELSDVVLYDRLVSQEILVLARSDAKKIYVGKEPNNHMFRQAEIQELMVEKALAGYTVARLKGGDPFVFGRGSEEAEVLKVHNIPFEVIPGVTSAIGALAYAGIPVTHRGIASGFHVVTGHECLASLGVNWPIFVDSSQTLVILMGLARIRDITTKLIQYGREEDTPVAVICYGTTAKQQVLIGTVGSIADLAAKHNLHSPATIVVGEVVRLADKLAWFQPSYVVEDGLEV